MNHNDTQLLIGGLVVGGFTIVVGAIIYYVTAWIIRDVDTEDEE